MKLSVHKLHEKYLTKQEVIFLSALIVLNVDFELLLLSLNGNHMSCDLATVMLYLPYSHVTWWEGFFCILIEYEGLKKM